MGYDMNLMQVPSTLLPGYTPQDPAKPGELRLSMYEMRVTFGFLGVGWADVLWDPGWPEFPAPGAFELTSDDLQAASRSPEVQARYDRFRVAHDEVTRREAIQDGKVALYKWSSNDGWWVTPAECRLVADKVKAAAPRIVAEYFPTENLDADAARAWVDRWVAYHELGAANGGYRVL